MNIVQGRAAVFSDQEKGELIILMDGFRIALTGNEAKALSSALSQGLSELGNYDLEKTSTARRDTSPATHHNATQQPTEMPAQTRDRGDTATRRRSEATQGRGAVEEPRSIQLRMLEATNAGIVVMDAHQPDNPIVFANAAAAAMTGYGVGQLIGQNSRIFFGPATDPLISNSVLRAF